jgi:hypothetical protein
MTIYFDKQDLLDTARGIARLKMKNIVDTDDIKSAINYFDRVLDCYDKIEAGLDLPTQPISKCSNCKQDILAEELYYDSSKNICPHSLLSIGQTLTARIM